MAPREPKTPTKKSTQGSESAQAAQAPKPEKVAPQTAPVASKSISSGTWSAAQVVDPRTPPAVLVPFFQGEAQCIAASVFENERPLRGIAGWLDWRFQGALSEGLRKGILTGKAGECGYVPVTRAGKLFHIVLAGGGKLTAAEKESGKRAELPAATWEALKKNLASLKLGKIAISREDMGGVSEAELEKKLKGVTVWIAP